MLAFCIGLAFLWLCVFLRGKEFTIKGWGSITLACLLCYGLGSIFLSIVGHK